MRNCNIAIIGYGGFGHFLHESWRQLDNVKITAVADEIAGRTPPKPVKFYQDWQKLLMDEEVDIVSIATPPATHSKIACAAMRAGKDVLIEKPIAVNMAEADELISVRNETGRLAVVDYMLRFNPIAEALAEISINEVFGRLRHANVENYAQDQGLPQEHWFWNRDISGGILIEHGVHFIDLVHSLTDQEYKTVTGFAYSRNSRQQDQVAASVLYDRGLIATHYHSFARPGFFEDTSMRLNYDLAQIDIHGWIPLSGRLTALVNRDTKTALEKLPGLKIIRTRGIGQIEDVSRPKGWGKTDQQNSRGDSIAKSGGIEYHVEEMVEADFEIDKPKQNVYADCVRKLLLDIIAKRENPHHKLRVTLEDGFSSLNIACLAAQFAQNTAL